SLIPDPTVTYTSPQATGTLRYTPVPNATGAAIITVTVSDDGDISTGGINTFSRTFTVAVAPANQRPVVTTSSGSLTYTQGQAATAIDPNVTVTDNDTAILSSASVAIITNYVFGEDVLDYQDQGVGISAV